MWCGVLLHSQNRKGWGIRFRPSQFSKLFRRILHLLNASLLLQKDLRKKPCFRKRIHPISLVWELIASLYSSYCASFCHSEHIVRAFCAEVFSLCRGDGFHVRLCLPLSMNSSIIKDIASRDCFDRQHEKKKCRASYAANIQCLYPMSLETYCNAAHSFLQPKIVGSWLFVRLFSMKPHPDFFNTQL